MKYWIGVQSLAFLLLCTTGIAQPVAPSPSVYNLHVLPVADTRQPQYVWTVGAGNGTPDAAFKDLASQTLRKWVSGLPKGTEIDYQSPWAGLPKLGGLLTTSHYPDHDLRATVLSFKRFCQSRGVIFADRFPVL